MFFNFVYRLSYPGTDVFLVVFDIASPASFHNVKQRWFPEIQATKSFAENNKPIGARSFFREQKKLGNWILVATNSQLRNDRDTIVELREKNQEPVSEQEGQALAKDLGAYAYIEVDFGNHASVDAVFQNAVRVHRNAYNQAPLQFRA